MKSVKSIYLRLLAALFVSLCLVTGCFGQNPDPSAQGVREQTVSSAADTSAGSSDSESPKESSDLSVSDSQAVQDSFDQLAEDIFREEAASSLLVLHYTLADPEAYGITDYDKTLGTISLEDSQESLDEAKDLLDELETIDSRALREDQRLTYTILTSYLNYILDGEGLELYENTLRNMLHNKQEDNKL